MVTTFAVDEAGALSAPVLDADLTAASARLPEGAYTTLRTYGRERVLRLEQHVRRLGESLSSPQELSLARTRRGLAGAVAALDLNETRFRITFAPPELFISGERFTPLPEAAFRNGVRAVTVRLHRENPEAKDTRFIATAARAYAGLPAGVNEGLLLAEDGAILEGLSSNFFAVRSGVLWTEEARVLKGVTRAIVIELAAQLLTVEPRPVPVDEIASLEECFVTSVSREVLPVIAIDGHILGDGRPGPITGALIARFAELVARESVALRG